MWVKKKKERNRGHRTQYNICARATISRGREKKGELKRNITIHVYDLREDSLLLRNREKESCRRHGRKKKRETFCYRLTIAAFSAGRFWRSEGPEESTRNERCAMRYKT